MRFLTDECISPSTVRMLRQLGHDVLDAKESKRYGISDQEIYRIACKENRAIFTTDERFRNYDPRLCGGVIVSLITPNTPLRYEPRLKHILLTTRPDDLKQKPFYLRKRDTKSWIETEAVAP